MTPLYSRSRLPVPKNAPNDTQTAVNPNTNSSPPVRTRARPVDVRTMTEPAGADSAVYEAARLPT